MADTIESLQAKLKQYEQNGAAKLFYSLNRKMNEMADIMNKNSLATLSLDDQKDKTFERLKVLWNDASSIAVAVKELGAAAGITGNEEIDVSKKPFVETIADKRV
jgi:hypothetical protein